MDKETALKILNLETTVFLEDAKKAYRNLAKKYHPDVVEKNSLQKKINAEAKMKEINLAFRFLAPMLKTNETIKKTGKIKKSITPEKEARPAFLSKMLGVLLKVFLKKNKGRRRPFEKNVEKEKPIKKTKNKNIRFDDIFKSVYKDSSDSKRKAQKFKKKKHSQKNSPYNGYQKYMVLKRKMKSRQTNTNQDISIGRIDKINPVRPVNPVERN